MKYFGHYLVSKGFITEEVLVSALIEQFARLPSVVEIIQKKKLMPDAKILGIFAHQTEKKLEFRQASLDVGEWTSEIENAVQKELESLRIPLGQILVKKGAIDLKTMTKALDEFLSRAEISNDIVKNQDPNPVEKKIENMEEQKNCLPVSEQKSGEIENEVFFDEIIEFLSDDRIQKMTSDFQKMMEVRPDSFQSASNTELKDLYADFRTFRGLLKLAHLKKSESIVAAIEALIIGAIEKEKHGDQHFFETLSKVGQDFVGLLPSFKTGLIKEHSELPWFDQSEGELKIENLSQQLNEILTKGNIKKGD